jgi:hypothetical protein
MAIQSIREHYNFELAPREKLSPIRLKTSYRIRIKKVQKPASGTHQMEPMYVNSKAAGTPTPWTPDPTANNV